MFDFTGETFKAAQGYDRGRKLGVGSIFWHSEKPEQGIGVQLTGQDLQEYRESGRDEIDLLTFIADRQGKVSTLHACINIHDAKARVQDIFDAQKRGTLKTRAKQIGQYSSHARKGKTWQAGDTAYIGSPKSGVQIRVYNKAAEQRKDGDWVRIEIIFRGKYAIAAHEQMLKAGIASVTRAAIRHQVALSAEWWRYAMHGDTSQPTVMNVKERNTIKWLVNVVLPVLEREIGAERKKGLDSLFAIYAAFIDRLRPKH